MKKFLRRLGCLTLLATLIAAAACGYAAWRVLQPYQGFTAPVIVDLARGSSTADIADRLAEAGVIRSRIDFFSARGMQKIAGHGRILQAGEYEFDRGASAYDVANRIGRGDTYSMAFTVPEGLSMFDIAAEAQKAGLFPAQSFLAAARDPKLIHDLDPAAPSLEGYLFPDTYKLGRHTTPEALCKIMTAKFRDVWQQLSPDGANTHAIVTLASLVEREGKVPDDRPLIAAVFTNRLQKGMKLDCDPTTIYAALIEGRYRGVIHRSDLDSQNPYNTYQHPGLPPGPIANPGRASLEAALHPADSDALFFVLRPDGSGRHEFTTSLAAHNKAVSHYRHGAK